MIEVKLKSLVLVLSCLNRGSFPTIDLTSPLSHRPHSTGCFLLVHGPLGLGKIANGTRNEPHFFENTYLDLTKSIQRCNAIAASCFTTAPARMRD